MNGIDLIRMNRQEMLRSGGVKRSKPKPPLPRKPCGAGALVAAAPEITDLSRDVLRKARDPFDKFAADESAKEIANLRQKLIDLGIPLDDKELQDEYIRYDIPSALTGTYLEAISVVSVDCWDNF